MKIIVFSEDMRLEKNTYDVREFGHLCTNSARAYGHLKRPIENRVFSIESEAISFCATMQALT